MLSSKAADATGRAASQLVRVGMMHEKPGALPQTVQAVDIKGEVLPDILTIAPWEINYAR